MLSINYPTLAAGQLSTSVGYWGMSGRQFVRLTSSAKETKPSENN